MVHGSLEIAQVLYVYLYPSAVCICFSAHKTASKTCRVPCQPLPACLSIPLSWVKNGNTG